MISARRAAYLATGLLGISAPTFAEYGRTAGSFDVSGGAAVYTIPIWTPPGPNGVQPTISINYSSQRGNGVAGAGWNLSAVSSIERCTRSIAQDGFYGLIEMSLDDRYCIDGKRMRLSSGPYGTDGSIYFTELADYSRITAHGTVGAGPEYFIVEGKNGLKYEYGATTDSRVFAGVPPGWVSTTPARWMLNKVSDRNGNNYVISYNNSNGFAVPDVISWTPISWGSTTYRYEAKFNYVNNRTDADSYLGKVYGYDVANRYRLETIQIKSSGVVKRKYRFAYDTSTVTSRSRLTSAKECADDLEANCLLPITFTYQTGVAGVTPGAGSAPAGSSNSVVVGRYDFNGDGKDDIAYWNGSTWNVTFGANMGFSVGYGTGISGTVVVDKFLPTGRAAFLTQQGGVLWTYRWDDATSSFIGNNTGIASGLPAIIDFNGDNMSDLVYYSGGTAIDVRVNISSGSGNPSFGALTPTAQLTGNLQYAGFQILGTQSYRNSDVNGDGRNDVRVQIVTTGMGGGAIRTTYLYGSNFGFDVPAQAQWINGIPPSETTVNFNGDRCADKVVSTFGIMPSNCTTSFATGVPLPAVPKLFLDWDGDGKMDLAVDNGGTLGIYLSTGTGLSSLISTTIPSTGALFAMDQDGDGLDDLIKINGTSALSYWTHTSSGAVPTFATNIPDLLSGVLDGFGVTYTPSYISTAAGSYDKGVTTNAPLQESGPMIVVAQVTQSNGVGGTFNRSFYYVGARTNANRGEFAGFQRIDETDSRNNIVTLTHFEQAFPIVGMVSQQEVMQPGGATPISRVIITNNFATIDAAANNQRYFPFAQNSTATEYEVGGAWNGALLRTVTIANLFDSATGVLYDQTVTTTEPASGANGASAGATWTARTLLTSFFNDTPNWCLGRAGRIQQINSHNLTYGSSITRTTDVAWNGPYCRPTQSIVEPGGGALEVTSDISYDSFGNVEETTVSGAGMPSRVTVTAYADATFTTGQFPLSVENAVGEISTMAWDYDRGVPSSMTDPNGISVGWQYDAFGRRIRENAPDGTYTTWDIAQCPTCLSTVGTQVTVETYTAASSKVAVDQFLLDKFDRPLYEFSRRLDGNYNSTHRNYDALGRVAREYFPYLSTGSAGAYSTIQYDLINRPVQVSRPRSEVNATLQYSSIYYEGLTTRAVDAENKASEKIANALGELARSKDHAGYYQAFDYDAFGAVKRVQDSAGNTLQSSQYNLRGMLTARTDMDMGAWSFTPNALGEVVSQTDAKNQTTTFGFDLLGRLTSRTEAEGTSTWTWGVPADNTASNKYVGRLKATSGPGYSESHVYDALGRRSGTTINADTSYQIDYSYNDFGALDTLTYPTSTSSYRLKLQYDYQLGHLLRIKDFNSPGTQFWQANATDARNQITQEVLGNGLVTNRDFDQVTGWLDSIQTGLSGGAGVQNLAYEWDLVGNLKKRKDVNQSNLTEEFFYDDLHRLDYSTLDAVTNLNVDYDALGNITSKSDVGTYTYHATKKHQLASTSNGWSFGYDGNGNMTSGRNATLTWTSYNYPASIANGSDTSSFSYTPDRQYWKQVSNYTSGGSATTIYAGGILEKVTDSTTQDFKHYIRTPGATIVVSRRTNGQNFTWYSLDDHLGSNSSVTTSAGAIQVALSYDAYGKRRGPTWSGSPSGADWASVASTTRRGYTQHTMLDNLGLAHMNGRIADLQLGNFLSADPFVPNVFDPQSYNRYSYVMNNPLTFIDPSGFVAGVKERGIKNCYANGNACSDYWRDQFDRQLRESFGGIQTPNGCIGIGCPISPTISPLAGESPLLWRTLASQGWQFFGMAKNAFRIEGKGVELARKFGVEPAYKTWQSVKSLATAGASAKAITAIVKSSYQYRWIPTGTGASYGIARGIIMSPAAKSSVVLLAGYGGVAIGTAIDQSMQAAGICPGCAIYDDTHYEDGSSKFNPNQFWPGYRALFGN